MKREIIQILKEAGCVKIRNSKGMLYQFESSEMSQTAINMLTQDAILDNFNTLCEQHKEFFMSIAIVSLISPNK